MGAVASRFASAKATPDAPSASSRPDFDTMRQQELALEAAQTPLEEVPSCLTLFDKWLTCYALGPQFRHVYRYGTVGDCSPRREDFKFCLTTRELEPAQRRDAWLTRRAEIKAHARQGLRSSETIWTMRQAPLLDPTWVDPSYPPP